MPRIKQAVFAGLIWAFLIVAAFAQNAIEAPSFTVQGLEAEITRLSANETLSEDQKTQITATLQASITSLVEAQKNIESAERFENAVEIAPDMLEALTKGCLLYTSPSPRDATLSRMPSSA